MGVKSFVAAIAATAVMASPVPQDASIMIVGGEAAVAGDFPFIVSLQQSGSHFCGGSLLNANTVLTAAHCSQISASSVTVRAGSLSRTSGGTLVKVSSIKVHPSYNADTTDYDVAIWKLATSIPESSTVGYATLPASGQDPAAGVVHTTAGWGTTTEGGSTLPTALRKVDVPIISRANCNTDYGSGSITSQMFCAGLDAGGKDSCQGDSGGPIVEKSTKLLVGTVSWGQGCARAAYPGVYARTGAASLASFIAANK